ncbi:MAG TPA: alpha/beta fold hydrolase [Polyangiaceae bacterium]|jgi:pimeloyl-ACP methyl ester carboxylesterase|nr:alpha/beta fold hydrolase [Polyangiaceae bacterium]
MSNTYVLIHDSWHDGGCWAQVARRLEEQGHKTFAPTLAGSGPGVERAGVTLENCIDSLVKSIEAKDLRGVTAVAHGWSGAVLSGAAPRIADRLSRLVFWNAFVLKTGESVLDVIPPPYRELFAALSSQTKDRTVLPPWEVFRSAFMQLGSEEAAREAYAQLTPTPMSVFEGTLDQARFTALDIPKSFLHCRQNLSLPPGEYAWYPRFGERLGKHKLVEADGCHEALFTNPAEIADAIIKASSD